MRDRPEPRLVLWDIDHTLIHLGGVGLDAYAAAFARATGRPWNRAFVVPGLTERAMVAAALRFHGLDPDPASQAAFLDYTVEEHQARADQFARRGGVLAGAAEALAALAATDGVRQSVLTGNLRSIALLKLRAFGLDRWLDLGIGAFGDEDTERADLVLRAWEHARVERGETYHGAQTVLIGDTVRDVQAALANGVGIVAVASGTTPATRLREAGADIVLANLADTERLLAAVHRAVRTAAAR